MALRTKISSKVKAGTPVITRKDLPDGTSNLVVLAGMPLIVNGNAIDGFDEMSTLDQMFSMTKYELCKYAKATGKDDDLKIHNATWVYSMVEHGEYGEFADPAYDLGLLNPATPPGWKSAPRCFSLSIAYPVLHNIETDDFGNWVEGTGDLALLELTHDANVPEFVIDPKHQSLAALMFNKLTTITPRQGVVDNNVITLDGPLGTIVQIVKDSKAVPRDMYKFEMSTGIANPEALMSLQEDVSMAITTYYEGAMRRWAFYSDLLEEIDDDGSNIAEVAQNVVNTIRSRVLDSHDFTYIAGDNNSINEAWASKLDLMSIEDNNTVDLQEKSVEKVAIKGKRKKRTEQLDGDDDLPF